MPVTMKDVARKAQVSLGTVSNYINGKKNIQPKNREKIEKAIKDLGYQVNEVARNLKMNSSMTIGIIIPSFSNIFAIRTISYLEQFFKENNYDIYVCSYLNGIDSLEEKIISLTGKKVDGIVIMPSRSIKENEIKRINQLIERKIPVAIFDSDDDGIECDHIVLNNYESIYKVTSKLITKGHNKIGLILGPEDIYSSKKRLQAYKDVLKENNIKLIDEYIIHTNYSKHESYELCKELLLKHPEITAIVTGGYRITLGTLSAINEIGLSVPNDLSIIGFDIKEIADILPYKLTGVNIPVKDVAKAISKVILKRINEGFDNICKEEIKMTFNEGDSIKKKEGIIC